MHRAFLERQIDGGHEDGKGGERRRRWGAGAVAAAPRGPLHSCRRHIRGGDRPTDIHYSEGFLNESSESKTRAIRYNPVYR